jgi:hypothetical protein
MDSNRDCSGSGGGCCFGVGSGSLFLYYYTIPRTPLRTQFKRISARGEAIYGVFFLESIGKVSGSVQIKLKKNCGRCSGERFSGFSIIVTVL